MSSRRPAIALLHWGDVIEDFLDPLGLTVESFRDELTGGWMFGYVEALDRAGVDTIIVCVSRSVRAPMQTVHAPTGARIVLLPPTRAYRRLRGLLRDAYAWNARDAARRGGLVSLVPAAFAREVAPYLATPARALADVLQRERCAALLCQEYEHPRFDVAVLVGRLLRLPVFATFQGGSLQRVRLERPLRRLALRECGGLIVGSSVEAQRVASRYRLPTRKIARIFNPLDVSRFTSDLRAATRAELGVPAGGLVVTWHGRVDFGVKGLGVLLAAWDEVSTSTGAENRLLLIGSGDGNEELRTRTSDREDVIWIDQYVLDRGRLAAYLAAGDIYASPSRREGFQVAPVEAMAAGLPVVMTSVGAAADILDQGEESGGVLVPPDDPAALAAALRRLLEDPVRRAELGRRARLRAGAFSYETVGQQLRTFLLGV